MQRTVELSDFESYLEFEYPMSAGPSALAAREAELRDRQLRLEAFPYSVVLKLSYPELDYANRWCWQQFGPAHGECLENYSTYPACGIPNAHGHEGIWTWHWLAKTDYEFGYNEWSFASEGARDRFRSFVPSITWGEKWQDGTESR